MQRKNVLRYFQPSVAVLFGLLLLAGLLLALPTHPAAADGPDSGHVVIQFDANTAIVRPISFTAPISGLEALRLTGLNIVTKTSSFGPTVCAIEGVGDSAANCFATGFWAYSYWDGSQWQSYMVGAGSSVITDGAIELWSWSPGYTQPPAPGTGSQFVAAANALNWLAGQQQSDGGYGDVGSTIETGLAVAANSQAAADWRTAAGNPSLLHNLYGSGGSFATGAGAAGKLAVELAAADACWPLDTPPPADYFNPVSGQYAAQAVSQAWAMLGTRALSQTVPISAATALEAMITVDGGWGWPGFGDDTDTTALAVEALMAAGRSVTSTHVVSGLTYIKSHQNSDGGFYPAGWSTTSSGASTSAGVRAILAAGQDPLTGTWRLSPSGNTPISYLVGAQQADGSFLYGSQPNALETRQAAVALLRRSFPLKIKTVPPCYGISGKVEHTGAGSISISANQPITDVTVTVSGWNNAPITVKNNNSGIFTASVPATGVYTVTLFKSGQLATTTVTATVSGSPGAVVPVAGATVRLSYLPLVLKQ